MTTDNYIKHITGNDGESPVDYITAEEAASILDVTETTVREYEYAGHIRSKREGRRVLYDVRDVYRIVVEYPKSSNGRRAISRTKHVKYVAPNIHTRERRDGTKIYYVSVGARGTTYRRTFRTLAGAENYRDKIRSRRSDPDPVPSPEETTEETRSVFRRILDRLSGTETR